VSYLNRYLNIKVSGRKRKLEHDSDDQTKPCTKFEVRLESYTDGTDNSTFKHIHTETRDICFNCHEDSFDCSSRPLLNGRLPTDVSNLRVTVLLADKEEYKKENLFMSFKFHSSMASPAIFNEVLILRLIFVAVVLTILLMQHFIGKLPNSESEDRNKVLTLIKRQLILQAIMDAPFYLAAYYNPSFIR
jgi:hypothetical protein